MSDFGHELDNVPAWDYVDHNVNATLYRDKIRRQVITCLWVIIALEVVFCLVEVVVGWK